MGVFSVPELSRSDTICHPVSLRAADAPKLANWAEENLPDGFTTFELPLGQRPRLRTTNCLERVNRELKRRTRVASIFPNTASCLRLVSAPGGRVGRGVDDRENLYQPESLTLISRRHHFRKFTEENLHSRIYSARRHRSDMSHGLCTDSVA